MTASHSSSVIEKIMRSRRMPALLTRTSRPAEGVDRLLDEARGTVPGADVVGVGRRLAAGGRDLVDDLLRRSGVGAGTVTFATEVVDHHLGAVAGRGTARTRVPAPDPRR